MWKNLTTRRSRCEDPKAIWHCEIEVESAYIPKIFFAPAARHEECIPQQARRDWPQARRAGQQSGILRVAATGRCDAHPDALQVALAIALRVALAIEAVAVKSCPSARRGALPDASRAALAIQAVMLK